MRKYTSLVRKVEEENPQEGRSTPTINKLNANINNIHGNRDRVINKPLSDRPKDTLKSFSPVETPQAIATSSKGGGGAIFSEDLPTFMAFLLGNTGSPFFENSLTSVTKSDEGGPQCDDPR